MSDTKKPFNVLITEEYTDSNGEVKKQWHRVGTAFENSKGGFNVELIPGISVANRFVILPRAEKQAAGAADDDGIPY